MPRKLFDRMNASQAAAYLMRKRRGNPWMYARDREDTCRTETEAFFWIRVQEELDALDRRMAEERRASEALPKVRTRGLCELEETYSEAGISAKGYGVQISPVAKGYKLVMRKVASHAGGVRTVILDSYEAALKRVLAYQKRNADLLHDDVWGVHGMAEWRIA